MFQFHRGYHSRLEDLALTMTLDFCEASSLSRCKKISSREKRNRYSQMNANAEFQLQSHTLSFPFWKPTSFYQGIASANVLMNDLILPSRSQQVLSADVKYSLPLASCFFSPTHKCLCSFTLIVSEQTVVLRLANLLIF